MAFIRAVWNFGRNNQPHLYLCLEKWSLGLGRCVIWQSGGGKNNSTPFSSGQNANLELAPRAFSGRRPQLTRDFMLVETSPGSWVTSSKLTQLLSAPRAAEGEGKGVWMCSCVFCDVCAVTVCERGCGTMGWGKVFARWCLMCGACGMCNIVYLWVRNVVFVCMLVASVCVWVSSFRVWCVYAVCVCVRGLYVCMVCMWYGGLYRGTVSAVYAFVLGVWGGMCDVCVYYICSVYVWMWCLWVWRAYVVYVCVCIYIHTYLMCVYGCMCLC